MKDFKFGMPVIYHIVPWVTAGFIVIGKGKEMGAVDALYAWLISERYADKRYLDFGISTVQGGRVLNEGLVRQKEGFGARAVMYDSYSINL